MLPLNTFAKVVGNVTSLPIKILYLDEALQNKYPFERVGILLEDRYSNVDFNKLHELGFAAVINKAEIANVEKRSVPQVSSFRNANVISNGDVIRIRPTNGQINVLYRRGANANSLLVTERCNSKCLMCSQPPREDDDSWILDEIFSYLHLIDGNLDFLGITGGEPTLLGEGLSRLIKESKRVLPNTKLHILSNGRNFKDTALIESLSDAKSHARWAIPLYSDLPHIHDYVVQANEAHRDTIEGIYNLAEYGHDIEIRFVLHKQTVPRLIQFAEFIYRNMPFVSHVALMGLEPIGYAKVNKKDLWIDPVDYAENLAFAARFLEDRGISTSIYNIPLCLLPTKVWSLAKQSISDWKNVYDADCQDCSLKEKCCGFFASYGPEWKSKGIKSIKEDLNEERLKKVSQKYSRL